MVVNCSWKIFKIFNFYFFFKSDFADKLQNGNGDKEEDSEAKSLTEKLGEMSVKSDSSKNVSDNKTDDEKKDNSEEQTESSDKKEEPPVKTES